MQQGKVKTIQAACYFNWLAETATPFPGTTEQGMCSRAGNPVHSWT